MKKRAEKIHVLLRGAEAGAITKADIERRARELALIRTGSEAYADNDLEEARRELLGERSPPSTIDDAKTDVLLTRDPAEPPSVGGHQEETHLGDADENVTPEQLVIQGVEEAQHDQMVQARRAHQGG